MKRSVLFTVLLGLVATFIVSAHSVATATNDVAVQPKQSGIYRVNSEIAAGKWRSNGGNQGCYWARRDSNQKTLGNHYGIAGGTVLIRPNDFEIELSNCGTWTYIENESRQPQANASASKWNGFFTVGVEIVPGRWRSTGSQSDCYWARLAGDQTIIDNHYGLAGGTITILASDYEVEFNNCGAIVLEEASGGTAQQTPQGAWATATPKPGQGPWTPVPNNQWSSPTPNSQQGAWATATPKSGQGPWTPVPSNQWSSPTPNSQQGAWATATPQPQQGGPWTPVPNNQWASPTPDSQQGVWPTSPPNNQWATPTPNIPWDCQQDRYNCADLGGQGWRSQQMYEMCLPYGDDVHRLDLNNNGEACEEGDDSAWHAPDGPGTYCSCTSDSMNCGNFSTQPAAQSCYSECVSQGRGDIHNLDRDGNGQACESLP